MLYTGKRHNYIFVISNEITTQHNHFVSQNKLSKKDMTKYWKILLTIYFCCCMHLLPNLIVLARPSNHSSSNCLPCQKNWQRLVFVGWLAFLFDKFIEDYTLFTWLLTETFYGQWHKKMLPYLKISFTRSHCRVPFDTSPEWLIGPPCLNNVWLDFSI